MSTRTSVCTRRMVVLVVVVVVVVASTCAHASSVLLHPDASLPLLPEQEGDPHFGLRNLSHTSPLQDTEYGDNGGFFLDEIEAVTRSDTLECPSANVITTRYKCQVKEQWVDCYRRHCCHGYNFVAGRCLPDSVDPCSQNFCEQKCSVYFGRVICTCFSGYRFSPENHKRGIEPVCLDIDECSSGTGICQHECINEPGSFRCSCRPGFLLRGDNTTCELESEGGAVPSPSQWGDASVPPEIAQARSRARIRDQGNQCSASCSSVGQMASKIRGLEEKIDALSTAVRLYSFAAGLPGPEGPPGPPGSSGPRGFPGPAGSPGPPGETGPQGPEWTAPPKATTPPLPADDPYAKEDFPLDSWTVITGQGRRKFCRCRRGAVGPPGAHGKPGPTGLPGIPGVPGEKGDPGSFDFLNLMIADVRHDIQKLQEKVFGDETPEPYDLAAAMARGEVSQPAWQKQYHSQMQEIMNEDYENRIFGGATRFQPHLLQLDAAKRQDQAKNGPSNTAMTEESKIPLSSPRPQVTRTNPSTEEDSIIQEQVLVADQEGDTQFPVHIPDGYYDTLLAHDDSLLEDYISHYDYGQLSEANYISDYALDAPIPSSEILSFSPSRTFHSAGPSVTIADPNDGSPHPAQSHIRASPGRRSLADDLTLAKREREEHMYNQSENVPIDLFSSQDSEQRLESKKVQPTMTLGARNSPNPSNIDSIPAGSTRSTTSHRTASHTKELRHVTPADRNTVSRSEPGHESVVPVAGRFSARESDYDYHTEQDDEEELSSWQHNSDREEMLRGNDGQLTSQEGIKESNGEGNKDKISPASVSEINKSRIRESEKLIEMLDDILREVNITEHLSRSPRNPDDDSPYHPRGLQQPSTQPQIPSDAPSSYTVGGNAEDESGMLPPSTQEFETLQRIQKDTTGSPETIPVNPTPSNPQEAAPSTHSGARGHRVKDG